VLHVVITKFFVDLHVLFFYLLCHENFLKVRFAKDPPGNPFDLFRLLA
jgi:hypothetical protein